MNMLSKAGRGAALWLIRAYQLTLSSLVGAQCRHLPTCSAYTAEAIERHGLWAGGWMGAARLCRCHPWGTHGFDPVSSPPADANWARPWRYGRWRWDAPGSNAAQARGDEGERDGAGVRDVEALDRAGHVEPRDEVAVLAREPAQALALAAEHEDEGRAERRR